MAAGLALPKVLRAKVLTPRPKRLQTLESEAYKPAVCKLCPALCMLQIRLVNGKPVGVSGHPGHPISQGAICPKGNAILQELYHPDRLRAPLRRKGPRGSDQWEQVSWEEARRSVQAPLLELMKKGHPDRLGILAAPIRDTRHELQRRFARAFGTPNFWEWNWPLSEAPLDAFEAIHGSSEGLFYDLMNAELIVSFGWDWLQAFPSPIEAQRAYSRLRRGRVEKRTWMIQVEPRLSISAAKADQWIAIRPNTEGFLAMGVAHALIEEDLYDKGFIARWTTGFEPFKRWVLADFGLEKISSITGVEVRRIRQLARELASIHPSLAITYRGSLFNQAAVHSLNLLTGSIGPRHGVLATHARQYEWTLPRVSLPAPRTPRLAPLHKLPETLLAASQSPLEMLWMERVNPVYLSPQPDLFKKALEKIPFIVCFTSFLDESCAGADWVLPLHSSLETWQDGFSTTLEGQGVVSFAPPVIEPLYETDDHGDFILTLARTLGGRVAQALPWENFLESLQAASGERLPGQSLREGGWRNYEASKEKARSTLTTVSARLQFPEGKTFNLPAIPAPPDRYPWRLYVHVPLAFSFGEGGHLPYLHSLAGPHLGEQWETWVEMHPQSAQKAGLPNGQIVWVESAVGRIKARLRHYEGIQPETVSLPFGLGHSAMGRYARGIGSNPSELVAHQTDEASSQPLWQGTLVRVYGA